MLDALRQDLRDALRALTHSRRFAAWVIGSLAIGMAGYFWFEPDDIKTWRDAFLNAAMLLGGMGPIHTPKTDGGKVFAGLYALFAGIVFVAAAGIVVAPVLHRMLHKFHWDRPGDRS